MSQRKRNRERAQAKRRQRRRRIRCWVGGALAVVVGFGLVLSLKARDGARLAAPERAGSLEVSATQIDLGQVSAGQWVTPSFRLRNVGAASVTVTVPRPGVETLEGC